MVSAHSELCGRQLYCCFRALSLECLHVPWPTAVLGGQTSNMLQEALGIIATIRYSMPMVQLVAL